LGTEAQTPLPSAPGRWSWLWRFEPWLYALVAGSLTLIMAAWFYEAMHWQLRQSLAWLDPSGFDPNHPRDTSGIWSAPLDDVFIHFDFARSTARGRPFEWVDGNGYSSGGTSILYPFVLALGMLLGFTRLHLMHFAAMVACFSTFGMLLLLRRAAAGLPPLYSLLIPLVMLSVGALDWSLFSGMEGAFFLLNWALAFVAWDRLISALEQGPWPTKRELWFFAAAGVLVLLTRPEALPAMGVFALDAGIRAARRHSLRAGLLAFLAGTVPGGLLVAAQAGVNRWFTGDFSAAGAIVKLEMNSPVLTRAEIWDAYLSHFKYQILRVTEYHFADNRFTGWLAWLLVLPALVSPRTRRPALILVCSIVVWLATVSLNGQVRWQNERYTMPAVAWLLAASALGLGALLYGACQYYSRRRLPALLLTALAISGAVGFGWGTLPRLREQRWFFGRASRNIFEQHVQVGEMLRHLKKPAHSRILVGDAGAIPYLSDLPALDVIGLGGTFGLPFARSSQWGIGASLELIQRLPEHHRPNIFAIYPSWWERLPLWFTSRVIAEFPVRGNVICGGHTKVVYTADFSSLRDAERPLTVRSAERVLDSLDFADLVDERSHDFAIDRRPAGFVDMKLLPHPEEPDRDLFDAGRVMAPQVGFSFTLRGFDVTRPASLLLRVAPSGPARLRVTVPRGEVGVIELVPSDQWQEVRLEVPPRVLEAELRCRLEVTEGGPVLYHLWAVQPKER